MSAYEKIKELRLKNKLTQVELAKKVGVSKGTISKWESGNIANMRRDKIAKLASALNTTPAFIFDWQIEDGDVDLGPVAIDTGTSIEETDKFISPAKQEKCTIKKDDGSNVTFIKDEQLIRFPIIGSITAGYTGIALEEYTGEYQVIPSSFLHGPPENYFILHVKGDSMYPRLLSGDCVLVKRTPTIPNGKVGVVLYNGDEATVKKINYDEGKSIDLIPFNPEYQTKHIEGEDLNQCKILGEVVKLIRDM